MPAKKRHNTEHSTDESAAVPASSENQGLGTYLAYIRGIKRLTLRHVEEATDKVVSNAYLSQIENGRVAQPNPNVLHSLSRVYGIPYDTLMEKAGYVATPSGIDALRSAGSSPEVPVSALAREKLTKAEEDRLLEYLAFLRQRKV